MTKVISFDEQIKLWENDREKAVLEFGEQYEVKYEFQKEDGIWTTEKMMFCSCGKDNHTDVEKEFQKRFPNAKIKSVTYQ